MLYPARLLPILTLALVAPAAGQEAAPANPPEQQPAATLPQEPREHPLAAEARQCRELIGSLLADKQAGYKTYASKEKHVRVHSDSRSSRESKDTLQAVEDVLQVFDWGLGTYDASEEQVWLRDDHPFELFLIHERENYEALIDGLIAIAPRNQAFLNGSRDGTGFTLYPAKLSVYFHNTRYQEEARVDHAVAHNAAHLELHRRYGFQPLVLAESLACAAEELALGEIWANWYRDGFVYSVSHGGWRGAATQNAVKSLPLSELWTYSARPYEDERAHLGYGWAIYALESQPRALHDLLRGIQKAYDAHPEQGGQYQLPHDDLVRLVEEAFGPELQTALRAYWKKAPKAPRTSKLRDLTEV